MDWWWCVLGLVFEITCPWGDGELDWFGGPNCIGVGGNLYWLGIYLVLVLEVTCIGVGGNLYWCGR